MNRDYHILIADRNPHVRKFLEREMKGVGYQVLLAKNCQEVLQLTYQENTLDLLIMDPDLPGKEEVPIWEKLRDRMPPIPVILHGFSLDHENCGKMLNDAVFIEKSGMSVEKLKEITELILEDTT